MMDRRESILAALVEVAKIEGIKTVARNKPIISEKSRPAVVILDADEQVDDAPGSTLGHGPVAATRIALTPEVYIMLGASDDDVGTALNAMRAKLIKAVLTSETLAALVGSNGLVRYEGCVSALARGREMDGEMGVAFRIVYVLRPQEL